MQIAFNNNIVTIQDDELVPKLAQIHETWPKLIQEYLEMIVKNRERQLERIVVTREIQARSRDNKRENK